MTTIRPPPENGKNRLNSKLKLWEDSKRNLLRKSFILPRQQQQLRRHNCFLWFCFSMPFNHSHSPHTGYFCAILRQNPSIKPAHSNANCWRKFFSSCLVCADLSFDFITVYRIDTSIALASDKLNAAYPTLKLENLPLGLVGFAWFCGFRLFSIYV